MSNHFLSPKLKFKNILEFSNEPNVAAATALVSRKNSASRCWQFQNLPPSTGIGEIRVLKEVTFLKYKNI